MPYDNLTTVASVKSWLKITGDGDDAIIGELIPIASDLIGRYCNRENLGAIYPYVENYFSKSRAIPYYDTFELVLRHWPVTALTSIMMNNSPVPIVQTADLQAGAYGVYLMEAQEPRMLKFNSAIRAPLITVAYSAGYAFNQIPKTLQQAANQVTAEIMRSQQWIGKKSISIAGETTTFDMGEQWGMSKRVMAMLTPYCDVIPFMGYA